MTVTILQGDAAHLPFADSSVDLVVTSPPYFGLRSYTDDGRHMAEQVGSEPTPAEYLDALITCTAEWMRVLKPCGSIFVNLGDKYAGPNMGGSRAPLPNGGGKGAPSVRRRTPGAPTKTLIGLPWRYAIRCIDQLGLILRAEVVWAKPNGLPESVTDRVRRQHEQVFHFVKQPRYFSSVDEVREESKDSNASRSRAISGWKAAGAPGGERPDYMYEPREGDMGYVRGVHGVGTVMRPNPLGKLPGSVWEIPTAPLKVPASLGIDHFAAYPPELVRRIVLGWSPREVCTACGEGRRPVIASVGLDMSRPQARRAQELADRSGLTEEHFAALLSVGISDTGRGKATQSGTGKNTPEVYALADEARTALGGYAREYLLRRPTALGIACACPDTTAPSAPGVVLDPMGGTGTTALVADVHGRHGITVDLSHDYGRVARWRTADEKQRAKAGQPPKSKPKPKPKREPAKVIPLPSPDAHPWVGDREGT